MGYSISRWLRGSMTTPAPGRPVFAQRYRRDFRVLFADMSWGTCFTPRNLDLLFCIGFCTSRCCWQALKGHAFLLYGLLNFAFPLNFVTVQLCRTYDARVPTVSFYEGVSISYITLVQSRGVLRTFTRCVIGISRTAPTLPIHINILWWRVEGVVMVNTRI